ncbi:hypothetical protein BV898_10723 [Hypsibius exemplaris]|uniref:Uncharacterized protein n=1 Tax=Hypsibius exemplaris TaxID=2072580 RepID=A0A1W0WIV7_HYPEX|nr:hypothetical protein BV898_10723 [Hypsibius exemplaris]
MILDCHRIGLVAAFAFLTSATLTDEAGVTSADTEDYNTDYLTGGLTGEFSATTEAAETEETTTVIIDYSVQDPKMLPSGTCWQEINRWRENPTFDDAMNRFHEKCRWATPANESCDATACFGRRGSVHR